MSVASLNVYPSSALCFVLIVSELYPSNGSWPSSGKFTVLSVETTFPSLSTVL